ncbi:MAG: c-type cytochrome [Xanthomonadales bacterium]|nr:c-type cytochrome [Xanthomonadales bacterium]
MAAIRWRCSEHPFSIASAPGQPELEFAIKELGDFTSRIGELPAGTRAYVDGPYGAFSIDRHPEASGFVFVAGGAGIAPILSMIRAMAARGDLRPAVLFYGNRRLDRAAYREELEALAARLPLRVVHVLHDPEPGWEGERGFIDQAVLARHLPKERRGWHAFVCGPKPMIRLAERALRRARPAAPRDPFGNFRPGLSSRSAVMRETLALIAAATTAALVLVVTLALALAMPAPTDDEEAMAASAAAPAEGSIRRGRELFLAEGCAGCHAVGGEGNPRHPLDGVGQRRDRVALAEWAFGQGEAAERLPRRVALAKSAYADLPAEDREALLDFLESLR